MSYWLRPQAAEEHKKQVAHYEAIQAGLGKRYHTEFQVYWLQSVRHRRVFRMVAAPDIRRAMFKVFHFDLVYREVDGWFRSWQLLTIAASQAIGRTGPSPAAQNPTETASRSSAARRCARPRSPSTRPGASSAPGYSTWPLTTSGGQPSACDHRQC